MGMLRVISCRGDDRLLWNEQDALAGDAEAMAFRVEAGKPAERLEQFDAQASQMIVSHEWWKDECGNARLRFAGDHRECFPAGVVHG